MAVKRVFLEDFSRELGEFSKEHILANKDAVASGVLRSVRDLVEMSPVDTGLYAQSWATEATNEYIRIGNFAPHSVIIENGARPFTPPIGPLLRWAKRKLKDPSQPPSFSPDVWKLARGTQMKIAREGMKPHHVMERGIPIILENVRQELRAREQ